VNASQLYRAAALSLVLGGLLVALGELIEPVGGNAKALVANGLYYPSTAAILIGGLLFIAGWPAVYLRQRGPAGLLGLAGMLLVLGAGALVTLAISLIRLLVGPWLTTLSISDSALQAGPPALGTYFLAVGLLATLGGVIFAIAVIRARSFSRVVGVGFLALVIVNLVISALSLPGLLGNLGLIAYMLGIAWFGVELYRSVGTESIKP
jgi:hypothetical protein